MLKLLEKDFNIIEINKYIKISSGKLHNMNEQIWSFKRKNSFKKKQKKCQKKKISEMMNSIKGYLQTGTCQKKISKLKDRSIEIIQAELKRS